MTPHTLASVAAPLDAAQKGARELNATVPVIGLWQPYASLVALGAKPLETRHFAPPKRLLGKRVAIQATLRRPTKAEVRYGLPYQIAATLGHDWQYHVPYGAVVCTAVLTAGHVVRDYFEDEFGGVVTLRGWRSESFRDDGFGDYSIGRWCWKLEDVHRLVHPIPLKGRQEIGWKWTPDAEQWDALCARALPPPEPPGSGEMAS